MFLLPHSEFRRVCSMGPWLGPCVFLGDSPAVLFYSTNIFIVLPHVYFYLCLSFAVVELQ